MSSSSTSSDSRILFSSAFYNANVTGHGGNRRAQQIADLLNIVEGGVSRASPIRETLAESLLHARWRAVVRSLRQTHAGPLRRARGAASFARNYGDWRREIARYPQAKVLVWEDTINGHTVCAAKDAGLRVVAMPQNLESLVPDSTDPRTGLGMPWTLEQEVKHLAMADSVYTISREEQWLLRLRGVAAGYLPFFPSPSQREHWLSIRRERVPPFDRVVVLGSAVNPPTRAGIRELLTWMSSKRRSRALPVHVVGYGTEVFRDLQSDGIVVHGALDDATLRRHLMRAHAVVLHQPAAVGALIRVSEMLLAGIPVIANPIAGRSTAQYSGVVIYDSFDELAVLVEGQQHWDVPPVPAPPSRLEQQFVATVSTWAR